MNVKAGRELTPERRVRIDPPGEFAPVEKWTT
jgi:hypothetical protein